MDPGKLDISQVTANLATRRVGRQVEALDRVSSTNDVAWERLEASSANGYTDGLVIAAEFQNQGRGRLGRNWDAPRGASLLFSVAIANHGRQLDGGELGLIAAVACCEGIEAATQVLCRIKWPNDLLINGRKVGGILVESRELRSGESAFVVGIGINCLQHRAHLPEDLREKATSLELESPQVIVREKVLSGVLSALDRWLASPSSWSEDDLRSAWRRRCGDIGCRIQLRQGNRVFSGTMIDVDPHAALLLQLDQGGIRTFDAADTTVFVDE